MFKKKGLLVSAVLSASLILAACGDDTDEVDGNGDAGEEPDTTETDESDEDDTADEGTATEAEYQWDFVTEEMQGEVQYEYAAEFARRLEEKSDGAIEMTVYEYGGLGDGVDQAEQLMMGSTEFGIVSPGFTGTMVEEAQVFALHFLFPDDIELTQEILNTSEALNVHLREKYEEWDMTPLAYWTEGAMQWTGSSPLRTPEDFDGFQIRVQNSPLIINSYEAYDASPTPMDWGELYTGLDQGVVDGQENPIFFIYSAGFHEVQDHMTISNHNNYVAMTVVNTQFYNSLPEDIQALIDETVEEMREVGFALQDEQNQENLDLIEEEGGTEVYTLSEDERQAFRDLAMPIRDYFRENNGEDAGRILDLLEEEIEAAQ
ncbi:DctP family TRAP transporter solute-binding subunit [Evansella cellulosilytica]|uniref:TRAP dicarboxylate transporter, DctP subunit n=1 Tax=Evansella cellulosilytica (strain ATCC 21833 / DSM 2522 / FERM P-1141 / JCM 9156 / N-4) TaxID=649639 RepID=E6U2C4_EVAC2|nr:DctP family TRAP transporter solute-binding subunit [Evansella cellulosilytica]ADU31637.1 TRAP dicarboxylate transporter, DctP subunit [Evansella cellulosilytica DSM 2522]